MPPHCPLIRREECPPLSYVLALPSNVILAFAAYFAPVYKTARILAGALPFAPTRWGIVES
jgi:hypothetical protein